MAGQLGGASREGVVVAAITAFFTLAGGYGAYLLGFRKITSPFAMTNALAFILSFFILYNLAAVWHQYAEIQEFCLNVFADPGFNTPELLKYREMRFRDHCRIMFVELVL